MLAEHKPPKMGDIIIQFTRSVAVLPLLAMGLTSPFVSADMFQPSLGGLNTVQRAFIQEETQKEEDTISEHAGKIDAYFKKRSMPLYGFGKKMAIEAEEHNLDWRLLPAIAVRESSGGKQACDYNPFGWASCKVLFNSFEESIEVVARNLGGDNPNTSDYYSGGTELKLHHYNGTVIPTYTKEVLAIMDAIGD
jgi:hypothetical protein